MNDSKQAMRQVELATFTPMLVAGLEYALNACDLCGAYVARREVHEQWHRQFSHPVELAIEWVNQP